jgi:hypothetical protein
MTIDFDMTRLLLMILSHSLQTRAQLEMLIVQSSFVKISLIICKSIIKEIRAIYPWQRDLPLQGVQLFPSFFTSLSYLAWC